MNCDIPQQANLLAYYRFDEGTAGGNNTSIATVADYSGNAYCGTFQNFALTGATSNYAVGAMGNCNTINPAPGAFSGNAPVCVNATITLSNANTGGTWSSASANVSVNSTTGVVTGVSGGTALVSYSLGCNSSTVTVTVNALPSISGGSNVAICTGGSTTLSASGGLSYTWAPGTSLSATTGASITANPTSTITYTVSGTDANSCVNTASVTVSVNALPTITPSAGVTVCAGSSTTLTASGASTYTWSPGTSLSATTGASVTANPASSITYTITGTDANTCVNTATIAVTVNALPTISGGSSVAICTGTSTTLTATGGVTYTWAPGTSLSATTGASVTANPISTITYTVTGTDANTCVNVATVTVTVNSLPVIGGGSNVAICTGNSAVLTAVGGVTYTWAPGGSLSATTGTSVTASPVVLTTYTITGTDANGCINTGTVTVSVNPLPSIGAGSDVTICNGSSTVLTVSGGLTYTWAPGTSLSSTAGTSVTANPSSTITYTVTGTDANGCINTASVMVSVNPLPSISGGSNVAICTGASTVLTASGGVTYTWAPGTALSATTGASVTANPVSTITYTVTGTDANTCVNTATVTVTVNSLPTISGGSNVAICTGFSTALTATGGVSYTWAPGTSLSSTAGSPVTANPVSTITYTVTGTDANGCVNTASVTVSVNPLPTISGGSDVTICTGTSTVLTASGGTSYTWAPGTSLSSTVGASVTANPTSTITYTVTGTDANGCVNTATVMVSVNPLPAISGGSSVAICTGASTVLTATGGVSYTWAPGTSLSSTVGSSVTANPVSTITYTVTGTDANTCANTATVTVSVNPLPTISGGSDVAICTGFSTVLTATGGVSYTWAPGTSLSSTAGSSVTANPVSTITYTVTGTDANGCVNTANVTVSVNPLPTISGGSDVTICNGSSTVLTATGGVTYTWAPGTSLSATTGSPVTANPSSTITYTVTGTDANGCVNTAVVMVSVNPLPTISGGSSVAICTGASTGLTATGGVSYTWAPGTSLSSTVGASVTANPVSTITYTVTGTDANTCVNTATVTVSVNPLPTISGGSNVVICNGFSTVLTATGGVGYTWAPGTSLSSTAGSPVTANPSSTITYTVTGTDANGCVNTASVTVSVNALPTVTASAGVTICSGNSTVLTASGAVSYTWAPGTSLAATTGTPVTANPASSITYTVTGTDANGCTNDATVLVSVNPTPAAITGSTVLSTAVSATLSDATAGGTWSSTNPTVATINSTSGVVTGVTPGTSTISYTMPTGCYATTSVTVNSSANGLNFDGVNDYIDLGSLLTSNHSYTKEAWIYPNSLGGNIISAPNFPFFISSGSLAAANNYSGGAPDVSDLGVLTAGQWVHVAVTYDQPTNTMNLYKNGVLVASNSAVSGYTSGNIQIGAYSSAFTFDGTIDEVRIWDVARTQPQIAASMNCDVPQQTNLIAYFRFNEGVAGGNNTSILNAFDYSGNSNCGAFQNFGLTGATSNFVSGGIGSCNAISGVVPGTFSGNAPVCVASSITISNSVPAGTWSTLSANFSVNSTSGVVTGVSSGTSLITYNLGCSEVGAPVTVNPSPAISGGSNTTICLASPTTLTGTGGVSYTWSPSAGLSSTTATSVVASPTVTTIYTVTGTNAAGCVNTASVQVSVNPIPTVYTVTGGGPYCSGGSGVLVGLSNSDVGFDYQVYRGLTLSGSSMAGTGSSLNFGFRNITGGYTIQATDLSNGCVSTMTGTATVTILTSPAVVAMTGGGSVCSGGPGVNVGVAGSAVGIQYQLYLGATPVGGPVWGVGSGFSFGLQTAAGTYTATATNTVNSCVSNMSGTALVTAVAGPTAFSMTGGGSYCAGGSGVAVGLASSTVGVRYQLFYGTSAILSPVLGTGAAISFGLQTGAGTYTVIATNNTTGCSAAMTGSAVISIDPLPAIYSVTGGGVYCAGGSGSPVGVSLSQSGVDYQLFRGATPVGSPVPGTGSAISFGPQAVAGTYTVVATNSTTLCTNNMGGSVVVTINPAPTAFAVTGGGSYCAGGTGVAVGLSNSVIGFNYQLFNGATPVGTAVAGTGAAISFGLQTTGGTYTVVATNVATTCTANMTGSAVVTVLSSPTIYTVTGGGGYCSGGSGSLVGLSNSQLGVDYQLYLGVSTVGSPVAGTGSAISFGLQTAAGTYTVVATTTATSCVNNMSGSAVVTINALPTAFAVTGGGSYCSGGTGVAVGLSNSTTGVNYQLFNGASPVGSPVAGTGAAISFGLQTTGGTYTVVATVASSSCSNNMTGSAVVTVNANPTVYAVTGGGVYCSGGTGVAVGLASSQSGVNYQLYLGVSTVGSPVAGTGSAISFGLQTTAGTYTVVATDATTSCTSSMSGSAVVSINSLPTLFNVTGGGSFCVTGTGVAVGLSGSQTGINYQLFNGASPVGSPLAGTGSTLSFGLQTTGGTYTVVGTNPSTTCTNTMTGSAIVVANPLPNNFSITGGGSFCSGTTGVAIGMGGSDVGVNYQLYVGGTPTGSPVAGTGSAVSFGPQTVSGSYTVVATNATTGCVRNILGSVTVTAFTSPAIVAVTGGGPYCVGGTGVAVGLAASATGVNYQLFRGVTTIGSPVAGVGSSLSFGLQTVAGTYTVVATNPVSGCTNNMSGSAVVTVYGALTSYTVTGGGTYCSGGSGFAVGLSSSDVGFTYQLYRGGSPLVGTTLSGTGSALSFGAQTVAGVYTVVATSGSSGCTATMSGSATITVNPLPTTYTVTGGGGYCSGGTGVAIGLSNSDAGINYQLFRGASSVGSPVAGTGSAITFGLQTTGGTYTVVATSATTGCASTMSGSVIVTVNSLPTVYTVSGGGLYCSGAGYHVLLSGSNFGINYQLLRDLSPVGSPLSGTGGGLDFGAFTVAGNYTVVGTNATTSCTNNMSGSAVITTATLPTAYTVTGGGSYCSGGTGVAIGVASSDAGINYQLYRGVTMVGSAVSGTGSAISFGLQTTAGTYTVVGTNVSLGCTNNMTGSAVVSVNPLPAPVTVTGGGSYCSGGTGVAVGLSGSASGISYQLMIGATPVGSPVTGTGTTINYGLQTTAGTYTVIATNPSTGCTNTMTGSAVVSVNSLPTAFTVTGGGTYCSGGVGVAVGLASSQTGVNYQLFNGASAVGSPVSGSGIAITFGLQTAAGTYTVTATTTSTGCTNSMAGSASITVSPLPTLYTVTGGGAYCAGGSGSLVGLSNSDAGTSYQLYNGALAVGSPVAGTGSTISFGLQTVASTFTVVATNSSTGCTRTMSGSATVSISSLPAIVSVTGGGTFCPGGTGVAVGLAASQSGVSYQLYVGATPTGSPVIGTGTSGSFGLQTTAGTYTVIATNAAGCTNTMSGTATVSNYATPTTFTVTGGGSYCSGGTGLSVGLSSSSSGVNYQLFRGVTAVGSVVAGTGSALSFGLQTTAGTYTVVGTSTSTSCTATMSGSVVISIDPLPTAFTVTGGGSYCSGGTGVAVGLANSATGVNYQLFNGATPVGSPVAGTGSAISFGLQTTGGTYSVVATNTSTTCTNNMTGSVTVTVNALPTTFLVTGGGSYCSGPGVHIYLNNSTSGVNYQLFNGASPVGSPVAGTGAILDFGGFSVLGTYTVVATNAVTSCVSSMIGSATVTGTSLPTVYSVTGGGSYCAGGTGVAVGVSNSDIGVTYQLYLGVTTVGSPVSGTGTALSLGLQTTAGTYTVLALNLGSSCTSNMTGSATVSVTALPAAFTVTGGGGYCTGGTGVAIGLSGSAIGVNYQLYLGASPVGSPVAGTGSAISFGLQTTTGTYSVIATDGSTSCTNTMTGIVSVSVNPLPTVFALTGGGSYCTSGTGVAVGLTGSQTGVSYQLFLGGSPVGSAVSGTGAAISFGLQTGGGSYSVVATRSSTGCTNNMSGSATVTLLPLPTNFALTGGGTYCSGGSGVTVGLAGSSVGINYQLVRTTTVSVTPVGSPLAGTGGALSFGLQTIVGTYTILATNPGTGCSLTMSGNATITTTAPPAIVSMTGGGSYCTGGTGVAVGLAASAIGVNYQLFRGATPVGSPVAGIGSNLNFGLQTVAGSYTVVATNPTSGCTANMSGTVTVSINPLPTAFTVTGGGSYCLGGSGVAVGLSSSTSGVTYKLYRGGTPVTGAISGTGSAINFGLQTLAGTYTAIATNSTTGCVNNMTGSVGVTVNPIPVAGTISGPSSVHDGATITLTSSSPGGVWTSSNTGIVTVGSASGIVTGVSIGYSNIFYTVTNVCGTVYTVFNVRDLGPEPPAGSAVIMGNTVLCIGKSTTLTASISGGTWTSGNQQVASIDENTGELNGNSAGIAAITYTTFDGMNSISVYAPVMVNPQPDAVTIAPQQTGAIVAGNELELTAKVNNGAAVQGYQWYLNRELVPGATNATYVSSTFANKDAVTCMVQGECGDETVAGNYLVTVQEVSGLQTIPTVNTMLSVTPNPSKGVFMISGSIGGRANEEVVIELTDVIGQIVYRGGANTNNGELKATVTTEKNLSNGMYLLSVRTGTENRLFHVVIER